MILWVIVITQVNFGVFVTKRRVRNRHWETIRSIFFPHHGSNSLFEFIRGILTNP